MLIPTSTGCYIPKTSSSFYNCTLRTLVALCLFFFSVCLLSCNTSRQDPGKGRTVLWQVPLQSHPSVTWGLHTYLNVQVLRSVANETPCLKAQLFVIPVHYQDVTGALKALSQEFPRHDAVWICFKVLVASFSSWQMLPCSLLDLHPARILPQYEHTIVSWARQLKKIKQTSWVTLSHGTLYNTVLVYNSLLKIKLENIHCLIYNTTVISYIKLKSQSLDMNLEILLLFILISSDEWLIVFNMTFKSFNVSWGNVPDSVTREHWA